MRSIYHVSEEVLANCTDPGGPQQQQRCDTKERNRLSNFQPGTYKGSNKEITAKKIVPHTRVADAEEKSDCHSCHRDKHGFKKRMIRGYTIGDRKSNKEEGKGWDVQKVIQ